MSSNTSAEYDLMKLVTREDVINIRAETSSNDATFACFTEDDAQPKRRQRLLDRYCSSAHTSLYVRDDGLQLQSTMHSKREVLAEQARQDLYLYPSAKLRWEGIALASLADTRKAVLRARKLRHDSISDFS